MTKTRSAKRTMVIDGKGLRYFLDGEEVSEAVYQAAGWKTKPPDYEKGECPGMHPDYADFSTETDHKRGVRGSRYFPQLARFPGDKKAFYPHKNAAKEEGKRRGYSIEED